MKSFKKIHFRRKATRTVSEPKPKSTTKPKGLSPTYHRVKTTLAGFFRKVLLCRHPSHKRVVVNKRSSGFIMPNEKRDTHDFGPYRHASWTATESSAWRHILIPNASVSSTNSTGRHGTPSILITTPTKHGRRSLLLHQGRPGGQAVRKSVFYTHPTVTAVIGTEQPTRSNHDSGDSWETVSSEDELSDATALPMPSPNPSIPSTVDLQHAFPSEVNVRQIARNRMVEYAKAKAIVDGVGKAGSWLSTGSKALQDVVQQRSHEGQMLALAATALPTAAVGPVRSEALEHASIDMEQAREYRDSIASQDYVLAERDATLAVLNAAFDDINSTEQLFRTLHQPSLLNPNRASVHPVILLPANTTLSEDGQSWFEDEQDEQDDQDEHHEQDRPADYVRTSTYQGWPLPNDISAGNANDKREYIAYQADLDPYQGNCNDAESVSSLGGSEVPVTESAEPASGGITHVSAHHTLEHYGVMEHRRNPPARFDTDAGNLHRLGPVAHGQAAHHIQASSSAHRPKTHSMNANGFPMLGAGNARYSAAAVYVKRTQIDDEMKMKRRDQKKKTRKAKVDRKIDDVLERLGF